MCRGYFSSQEIDSHHATEHRSTDQSRNGCGMCCFCHAQPFEITRAKNIKNPLVQRSCQNAKVVQAFCSRRVHHRDRHQHTIPIALAALPGATLPRLRALALFGRRPPQRVDSLLMPASENLHSNGRSTVRDLAKSGQHNQAMHRTIYRTRSRQRTTQDSAQLHEAGCAMGYRTVRREPNR